MVRAHSKIVRKLWQSRKVAARATDRPAPATKPRPPKNTSAADRRVTLACSRDQAVLCHLLQTQESIACTDEMPWQQWRFRRRGNVGATASLICDSREVRDTHGTDLAYPSGTRAAASTHLRWLVLRSATSHPEFRDGSPTFGSVQPSHRPWRGRMVHRWPFSRGPVPARLRATTGRTSWRIGVERAAGDDPALCSSGAASRIDGRTPDDWRTAERSRVPTLSCLERFADAGLAPARLEGAAERAGPSLSEIIGTP